MNIADMRYILSKAYAGPSWRKKVESMSDEQVIAIYYRITTGKPAMSRKNGKSTTNAQAYKNVVEAIVEVAEKKNSKTLYREQGELEKGYPQQLTLADFMKG